MMMVLFQNKIIYMPSVPPFSRSEKIEDYEQICNPIRWRQEMIRSLDGTKIALAVGENQTRAVSTAPDDGGLVIVYFQGNGSSLPPRLPGLSRVLKQLDKSEQPVPCTVVALSYRGYWTSSGRASQGGIEQDAAATLGWANDLRESCGHNTKIVVWGQSIGAGVATTAMANSLMKQGRDLKADATIDATTDAASLVDAMILETPFTSVSNMLIALYPQKWLPYRYLTPFLWNSWDSMTALRQIKQQQTKNLNLLIMTAGKDEVVPVEEGQQLIELCEELHFDVMHQTVPDALHTECLIKAQGSKGVVEFLNNVYRHRIDH